MHELGVVVEIIKKVEKVAIAQNLQKVDTIVLQIGELSSMIPKYIEECFPAAVDGTKFEETKLKIEILPANGLCKSCSKVFNIKSNGKTCPVCLKSSFEILGGKEFFIKEIIAY